MASEDLGGGVPMVLCVYTCINKYVYIYIDIDIDINKNMNTHTHTHIYIYIYTHMIEFVCTSMSLACAEMRASSSWECRTGPAQVLGTSEVS